MLSCHKNLKRQLLRGLEGGGQGPRGRLARGRPGRRRRAAPSPSPYPYPSPSPSPSPSSSSSSAGRRPALSPRSGARALTVSSALQKGQGRWPRRSHPLVVRRAEASRAARRTQETHARRGHGDPRTTKRRAVPPVFPPSPSQRSPGSGRRVRAAPRGLPLDGPWRGHP